MVPLMVSLSNHERSRFVPLACAIVAAIGGVFVAWHYHRLGLTLTHYDARGHLVVARRIFDSITPGWQQIGAVWLPLPHLLNAIPVQIDLFYRTGASAVAISIAAFAVATGAIASIVLMLTASPAAAAAGAAVFALNPNVLYLQSTPMTEPLLIALTTVAIAWTIRSLLVDGSAPTTGFTGSVFALACLTRYEAWPVTACALAAAVWARWRRGEPFADAMRSVARIAVYPALAIVAFAVFSRVVVGRWFVSSDFFVPENKSLHDPIMAAKEIGWGLRAMSGHLLVVGGASGVAMLAALGLFDRRRGAGLVAVALVATAVVPWLAFYDGHPFRIRYMVPLLAAEAIGAGFVAGLVRRAAIPASLIILTLVAYELHPLDASAPMVVEAQWDRPNEPERARVTACIGRPGTGQKIMASMGSLGHYMQDASRDGFAIRDFLHEGNGDIWLAALENPLPFAEWILIEEKAEGGDLLAKHARERPAFLRGYSRACEGAGLALYVRSGSSRRTGK